MIHVLNNILYYLNLAALLQSQHENNHNFTSDHPNSSLAQQPGDDNGTIMLPPILVKQIPPGPIVPGVVVKFVCSVDGNNNGNESSGGCIDAATNNTFYNYNTDNFSYQWEMYQYMEDKNGSVSDNANVVQLPGQDSEMEMEFNESVANPNAHCDLVCTIKNQPRPSSASIKLHFISKDRKILELAPPSNFKLLDVTSRAVYFAWNHPQQIIKGEDEYKGTQPEVTGYIIEYKNGKGTQDWRNEKVSRYEIKRGSTHAVCITNLVPWTTYHFRIVSCSRNTTSRPSLPIIVRTAEDFPSAAPLDVKMEIVEEKSFQVSWKPPPRSSWNGALLGYSIGLKRDSDPEDEPYDIYIFSPRETLGNVYSSRITVPDLTTPYKVVVQAINNVGGGPFSLPVKLEQQNLKTKEE